VGNSAAFAADEDELPEQMRELLSPEQVEHMRELRDRFSTIAPLLEDERVYMPFTVVHATRVD
jgi:hypothetical protein